MNTYRGNVSSWVIFTGKEFFSCMGKKEVGVNILFLFFVHKTKSADQIVVEKNRKGKTQPPQLE